MKFLVIWSWVFVGGALIVLGAWEAIIIFVRCCNDSIYLYWPFALVWLGASPLIVWLFRRWHTAPPTRGEISRGKSGD
jgi:hypothetical protein